MSNYIPLFYVDVITYPCPNPEVGLANPWGPSYQHGLTLIPAWISNYTHYNVWDEITYPFLNFNGASYTLLSM